MKDFFEQLNEPFSLSGNRVVVGSFLDFRHSMRIDTDDKTIYFSSIRYFGWVRHFVSKSLHERFLSTRQSILEHFTSEGYQIHFLNWSGR